MRQCIAPIKQLKKTLYPSAVDTMKHKKSQIWISAVLYILIAAIAMVIILQAGIPLLNKMRDRTTFERSKGVLSNIDQKIIEVAAEGQGSQRVVPVDIREGNIIVDETNNKLKWELETKSEVIEPRTSLQLGNLKIYSNIEVDTAETATVYTISNSRVKFVIKKVPVGTTTMNVNQLIQKIYYLNPPDETEVIGAFTFSICDPPALTGKGYTEMIPAGDYNHIGSVKIIAHMLDSDTLGPCGNNYDLELILDSQADFLKTRVINLDKR